MHQRKTYIQKPTHSYYPLHFRPGIAPPPFATGNGGNTGLLRDDAEMGVDEAAADKTCGGMTLAKSSSDRLDKVKAPRVVVPAATVWTGVAGRLNTKGAGGGTTWLRGCGGETTACGLGKGLVSKELMLSNKGSVPVRSSRGLVLAASAMAAVVDLTVVPPELGVAAMADDMVLARVAVPWATWRCCAAAANGDAMAIAEVGCVGTRAGEAAVDDW